MHCFAAVLTLSGVFAFAAALPRGGGEYPTPVDPYHPVDPVDPVYPKPPPVHQEPPSCAKNHSVSCCTTDSGSIDLLGNLLGGSCLVPNLISISNTCPGQNVYCCPTDQSGALDLSLSCIPIQA